MGTKITGEYIFIKCVKHEKLRQNGDRWERTNEFDWKVQFLDLKASPEEVDEFFTYTCPYPVPEAWQPGDLVSLFLIPTKADNENKRRFTFDSFGEVLRTREELLRDEGYEKHMAVGIGKVKMLEPKV